MNARALIYEFRQQINEKQRAKYVPQPSLTEENTKGKVILDLFGEISDDPE